MNMAALLSKLAGFMGARLAGAAIGFASQLVLARLLDVHEVGIVLLAMSVAAFVGLGANGGYALLAMTEIPKLATHGRTALIDAYNRVAVADSVIAYVALAAVAFGLAQVFELSTGQTLALVFGFLCAPASISLRYNSVLATTVRRHQLAYLPDFFIRPGLFFLCLLGLLLAGSTHSVTLVLLMFVGTAFFTAIVQRSLLHGDGLSLRHLGWTRTKFRKAIRTRAFALTLVSAVLLAFADIVTLVAGFILPEADVALVGICIRLSAIAGFVLQAGQTYVSADLTQAIVKRDSAAAEHLLKQINFATLGIIACALLCALLLGDFLLALFGPDYRQGYWLLILFLVGQSIRALGGMNQQILSTKGHQLRMATACLLTIVVLISTATLFCAQWGVIGMGYAVIAAELAWLLLLASQASALCGQRGDLLWVLTRR
jgi:O-antigen/teichoic acid export membrane protein